MSERERRVETSTLYSNGCYASETTTTLRAGFHDMPQRTTVLKRCLTKPQNQVSETGKKFCVETTEHTIRPTSDQRRISSIITISSRRNTVIK